VYYCKKRRLREQAGAGEEVRKRERKVASGAASVVVGPDSTTCLDCSNCGCYNYGSLGKSNSCTCLACCTANTAAVAPASGSFCCEVGSNTVRQPPQAGRQIRPAKPAIG
ncbi:unnamed protein product, partial [Protopolystoma xenopodis]